MAIINTPPTKKGDVPIRANDTGKAVEELNKKPNDGSFNQIEE